MLVDRGVQPVDAGPQEVHPSHPAGQKGHGGRAMRGEEDISSRIGRSRVGIPGNHTGGIGRDLDDVEVREGSMDGLCHRAPELGQKAGHLSMGRIWSARAVA